MKKDFLLLLAISLLMATLGLIFDGDQAVTTIWLRIIEFMGMLSIVFALLTLTYFPIQFYIKRRLQTQKIQ